ncbi:hypothetical protein SAMN02745227_01015 [Anaerobranca californiensis DSM 14826]|uniref:HD domain-containing protein n=1 Tax=Anaerobranca californiensis DSM 14826 TaxID=1120989 RepID=A0A1M6N5T6_9FIRM|nr:HDIG domain-containing metalloprotein [Anaerobranca californiensis]SHJ90976.1 hypothetical protein SAMN02745227_01015 [Anaerobranca californiensis DSM 14826]
MFNFKKFTIKSSNFLQTSKTYRYIIYFGVFFTTFFLLAVGLIPPKYSLEVGQVSPETIYAPRTVVDPYLTKLAEEEAVAKVPDVYVHDQSITNHALTGLSSILEKIEQISLESDEEMRRSLIETLPKPLQQETALAKLINLSENSRLLIYNKIYEVVERLLNQGIKVNTLENAQNNLIEEINSLTTDLELREYLYTLSSEFLKVNLVYSAEATEQNRREARRLVEEVKILKDSKIIDKGEVVTEHHIIQLEALGLQKTSNQDLVLYLGLLILTLTIFAVIGVYLYMYQQDVYYDSHKLLLLGLILLITLILAKALSFFSIYLIPITLAPLLISILFNRGLATMMTIVLAILTGVIVGNEFKFIVLALVSGLVAVYTTKKVIQRSDLTRAGAIISGVNVTILVSISLLTGSFGGTTSMIKNLIIDIMMGMLSGVIASILAIGILPFLENAFSLTTSIRLLELANPNNGALKRLLIETPGTYHHSIIVGNLAEAAAEEIGADPILARVGAYYHDIGKVTNPYYFIENQLGMENIHDSMDPKESAKIIIDHVEQGVQLAKSFGLPGIIIDLIRQSHGTTKLEYFYHKAKELYGEEKVNEGDYRYPGPKPQTKEAAILMFADSIEAAVRSIKQPTQEKICQIIEGIINNKISDGQLDQCPITLYEINKIKEKLTKVIMGIFHQRIQYPINKEEK